MFLCRKNKNVLSWGTNWPEPLKYLNLNEIISKWSGINTYLNWICTKSVYYGFLSAGVPPCGPNAPRHVAVVSGRDGCHASIWRPAGAFRFCLMQHVKEHHVLKTESRVFQELVLSGSVDPGKRYSWYYWPTSKFYYGICSWRKWFPQGFHGSS